MVAICAKRTGTVDVKRAFGSEQRASLLDGEIGARQHESMQPIVIVNVVSLTARMVGPDTPNLQRLIACGEDAGSWYGHACRHVLGPDYISDRRLAEPARNRRQRLVFPRPVGHLVLAPIGGARPHLWVGCGLQRRPSSPPLMSRHSTPFLNRTGYNEFQSLRRSATRTLELKRLVFDSVIRGIDRNR
jgi:hypothetical protein